MFEPSYDHTQKAPWYLLLFAFAALFFTGRPEFDAGHDDPRPDPCRWLLPVLRSQSAVLA